MFDRAVSSGDPQTVVLAADWTAYRERHAAEELPPFFAEVSKPRATTGVASSTSRDAPIDLSRLAPRDRAPALERHVMRQAIRILGLASTTTLNPHQPLQELGLDSLMAVELRNTLGLMVGRTLPATLLFDYPTIGGLTANLLAAMDAVVESDPADPEDEQLSKVAASLEHLSESEAESLLRERLEQL
jgi:polyketide synthase 12/myxalamid-type polyketide synthase MxaB